MKKLYPIILLLLIGLIACQSDQPEPVVFPTIDTTIETYPTPDPVTLATGEQVYQRHCAECHGTGLQGETNWPNPNPDGTMSAPPHSVLGYTWTRSDQEIYQIIMNGGSEIAEALGGEGRMPAFDDVLTDAEVWAVMAYIKESWPDDLRQMQWQITQRANQ